MRRILAIDTTARSTHCALLQSDLSADNSVTSPTLLAESSADAVGTAESLADILLRIEDDLPGAVNSVTSVVVAVGPGSFTGIRSGIASAQGFAAGRSIPVLGISVLLARLVLQPITGKILVPFLEGSPTEYFYSAFTLERRSGQTTTIPTMNSDVEVVAKDALEQRLLELEEVYGMPVSGVDIGFPGNLLPDGVNPAIALGRAAGRFAPESSESLGMHWQESDRGIGLTALYVKGAQAKTIAERRQASGMI